MEAQIRELCQAGDYKGAVTLGIKTYGGELYSYLAAIARSDGDASDAYGRLCLGLWEGLPGFRWECTFRTWAYVLARNAFRSVGKTSARFVPLSHAPEIAEVAEAVRSRTAEHLRTEVKDQVAKIRESLSPEDRTLLILRVDRKLGWREIARVMAEEADADTDDASLDRRSAALRKRFERVKAQIKELAGR